MTDNELLTIAWLSYATAVRREILDAISEHRGDSLFHAFLETQVVMMEQMHADVLRALDTISRPQE